MRGFALTLTVAVGVGAAPRLAHAFPAGGMFAGPTRATGFSLYWNPAAVASLPASAPGVELDLVGSLVHLSYERAGLDPNTGQSYDKVEFTSPAPDPSLTLVTPAWGPVRWTGGIYSPTAVGADWPKGGAQRYFSNGRSSFITAAAVTGPVLQLGDDFGLALVVGPLYGRADLNVAVDFGAFVNSRVGSQALPLEDPLLEGQQHMRADGWSVLTAMGVWARPLPWWRLGLGVAIPKGIVMHGHVIIDASDELMAALPGFQLDPKGDVEVRYPMPWQLSAESEVEVGSFTTALLFQYIKKSVQHAVLAYVTEASPKFIEGRQVSVKNLHDDWMVGLRVDRKFSDELRAGLRFDYDPRYIPNETVQPINLDYTQFHLSAGALYRLTPSVTVSLSYSYVYLRPYTVTESIYSATAPADSGLNIPSANGRYAGYAHMLGLGFEGAWEEQAPAPVAPAPVPTPPAVTSNDWQ